MSEYITLIGADDVSQAGHNMQGAADSMRQSAGYIDESLRMFLARFEELVVRLENLQQEPEDGN